MNCGIRRLTQIYKEQKMNDKIVDISALVGAIYIIARVIVVLTPTPVDDKILKKFGGWLWIIRQLCNLTGLDVRKGIKKYTP